MLHEPRTLELRHRLNNMIRQRVFGVTAGYKGFNDDETLRYDYVLQMCRKKR